MGLHGTETLDRLQLYCDTFRLPALDAKQQFKEMMQAKDPGSDSCIHTVQVIFRITDDIVYHAVPDCSKVGLQSLRTEAEPRFCPAFIGQKQQSPAFDKSTENPVTKPKPECTASMQPG